MFSAVVQTLLSGIVYIRITGNYHCRDLFCFDVCFSIAVLWRWFLSGAPFSHRRGLHKMHLWHVTLYCGVMAWHVYSGVPASYIHFCNEWGSKVLGENSLLIMFGGFTPYITLMTHACCGGDYSYIIDTIGRCLWLSLVCLCSSIEVERLEKHLRDQILRTSPSTKIVFFNKGLWLVAVATSVFLFTNRSLAKVCSFTVLFTGSQRSSGSERRIRRCDECILATTTSIGRKETCCC